MNEQTKELIAIGASITGHCQPCLTYHVAKARDLGVDEQDIREAIAVGHMVEKGSMSAMRDFAESALDSLGQNASTCCSGKTSQGKKKCCS
jgi:AhpD family alkylhydroperoxidase